MFMVGIGAVVAVCAALDADEADTRLAAILAACLLWFIEGAMLGTTVLSHLGWVTP
jgi:hypothetical protein